MGPSQLQIRSWGPAGSTRDPQTRTTSQSTAWPSPAWAPPSPAGTRAVQGSWGKNPRALVARLVNLEVQSTTREAECHVSVVEGETAVSTETHPGWTEGCTAAAGGVHRENQRAVARLPRTQVHIRA